MEQKKIEEFVKKAQQAKSPEEGEAAVKERGPERTDEALADDALDNVTGGKSVIIQNGIGDKNRGDIV